MVILVDTNIIIDALANREPYADDAKRIMEKCAAREITGILAAHSIPNLFYILRKKILKMVCRKNVQLSLWQIILLHEIRLILSIQE